MMRPVRSTLPGQISLEVAPIRSERPADLRDPSLKTGGGGISINRVTCCVSQLNFSRGDRLLVHAKPSSEWWWAELQGVIGYVPASYLSQDGAGEEEEDPSIEDPWQDEEYFGNYGTLVGHFKEVYCFACVQIIIMNLEIMMI